MAVEYTGRAQPRRTCPFRTDVLDAVLRANSRTLEKFPGVAAMDFLRPHYVSPYANGDLLVSFVCTDPERLEQWRTHREGRLSIPTERASSRRSRSRAERRRCELRTARY